MKYSSGTIVICSGRATAYSSFVGCMLNTQIPEGTELRLTISAFVDENRNESIKRSKGEWVWFVDDDHIWEPDLLLKLLDHDKDIVVPFTPRKFPPFDPVLFKGYNPINKTLLRIDLKDIKPSLIEVYAAGAAGMLIKRKVFEKISYPWFEIKREDGTIYGEDIMFSQKARENGFKIFADLNLKMGHIADHIVNYDYRDEKWNVRLDLGEQNIFLPIE